MMPRNVLLLLLLCGAGVAWANPDLPVADEPVADTRIATGGASGDNTLFGEMDTGDMLGIGAAIIATTLVIAVTDSNNDDAPTGTIP